MKEPVLLRVYQNGKLVNVKQFTDEQIVLGFNDSALLPLKDETISPIHAVIEKRDAGYYIADLGSTEGTFVNGERIFDTSIDSGDEIQLGVFKLEFFIGVPKPSQPPKLENKIEPPHVAADIPPVVPEPISEEMGEPVTISSDETPPAPTSVEYGAGYDLTKKTNSNTIPGELAKVDKDLASTFEVKKPTQKSVEKKPEQPINFGKKGQAIGGTFAPPSEIQNLNEVLRPDQGGTVEVLVAWRERVIGSYHYKKSGAVSFGSKGSDGIQVPVLGGGSSRSQKLLKLGPGVVICIANGMSGTYFKGDKSSDLFDLHKTQRLKRTKKGYELRLEQDEMVHLSQDNGNLNFYIRYVPDSPKPLVAPFLDLTTSEVTGVVLAVVLGLIFSLYMMVYSPSHLEDEDKLEEKIAATVIFKQARPPVKVVDVSTTVKVKTVTPKKENATKPKTTESAGKAAALVDRNKPKNTPKKPTSAIDKGSTIKTGKTGSGAKPRKNKDVNKVGLLNVFGGGGVNKNLSQNTDGVGGLVGAANKVTGFSGDVVDRQGDNLGGALKNTGASGSGKSMVGAGGINTRGKGRGDYGAGSGGLGERGKVDIDISGDDADIEGFMDREAIRRVIISNKSIIRSCYERGLNQRTDLHGKVIIRWTIEEGGRVGAASAVSNTMAMPEGNKVANCIVKNLKSWRFPEPPEDRVAEVKFPFVFSSQ